MRMRRKKYLDERLAACAEVNLGWLADYAAEQIVGNVHFGQMPQHSDIIIKLNDKGQIV